MASNDTDIKTVEWRCFFCSEVFTNVEEAAEHFGCDVYEADQPACQLMKHQKHFMQYVRGLENEIRQYKDENTPLQKAMWSLESTINHKVAEAEEKGYAKGVRDMQAQGLCPEPQKHSV